MTYAIGTDKTGLVDASTEDAMVIAKAMAVCVADPNVRLDSRSIAHAMGVPHGLVARALASPMGRGLLRDACMETCLMALTRGIQKMDELVKTAPPKDSIMAHRAVVETYKMLNECLIAKATDEADDVKSLLALAGSIRKGSQTSLVPEKA